MEIKVIPAGHSAASTAATVRKPQPKMVSCRCAWCKQPFEARASDRKRGWGKFCSKSCKAMKQEKRTGQFRDLNTHAQCGRDPDDEVHQQAMADCTAGWDEGGWRDDDSGCASD